MESLQRQGQLKARIQSGFGTFFEIISRIGVPRHVGANQSSAVHSICPLTRIFACAAFGADTVLPSGKSCRIID